MPLLVHYKHVITRSIASRKCCSITSHDTVLLMYILDVQHIDATFVLEVYRYRVP
jgi:hypothetical protein